MIDIKLDSNGDIDVSAIGDISLTNSICQAILVRIRWIYNEWRLGPEIGFPWFEEVFVKNPNTEYVKQLLREKILEVDGVTDATVDELHYDQRSRTCKIIYTACAGEEVFREEVKLYERVWAYAERSEY